jgi:uncharacterized membrane protein YdbT with pleckstrin-like domain
VPFPRKLLNEGEETVVDIRPHWWFLAPATAALVAAIVFGVVVLNKSSGHDSAEWDALKIFAGVILVVCIVWFAIRYAKWTSTNFVVTTDRVVYRHGVVAKHGIEIPLERVNTVFFNQTIFERMIGAGDLSIESGGETGKETFSDIMRPSIVQNEIYKQMEANENRKFDRIGPAGPQADSIPAQLDKLDELRRRGVISDEEFSAKKAQLLDRM